MISLYSCTDAKFNPISAVLLSGLVKLIGEAKEVRYSELDYSSVLVYIGLVMITAEIVGAFTLI